MTKNTKLQIDVCIPAFNEANTILDALKSIYSQNTTGFKLARVIVYSDGGSDDMVDLITKNYKKVIVYDYKKNLGKRKRVNQILKVNTADILLLMDADVTFKSKNVFNELIKPFKKDSNMGLVCAYFKANKPTNFIGKISYFGYTIWDTSRSLLGASGIRYYAEGGLLALSREHASTYRISNKIKTGDDSFLFYKTAQSKYRVSVAKKAVVTLTLAESLSDYVRQMTRFLDDPNIVTSLFSPDLTSRYETMTTSLKLKVFVREFVKNPLVGSAYVIVQGYCKVIAPSNKSDTMWKPIERK